MARLLVLLLLCCCCPLALCADEFDAQATVEQSLPRDSSSGNSSSWELPSWNMRLSRWWPFPRVEAAPAVRTAPARPCRLPAEFEQQQALLLSCHEMVTSTPDLFANIVLGVGNRAEVVALVNDAGEATQARFVLEQRGVAHQIHFVEMPHNTMWVRDYGPMIVERGGRAAMVDADYSESARTEDDMVPARLAQQFGLGVVDCPLRLEGGNLLSNGRGVLVSSTKTLGANADLLGEENTRLWMSQAYGSRRTFFLEPLLGEPTGHVDMFVTFTAPGTVVVGAYDPSIDPENAAILDRNAARLAEAVVDGRPMRVVRIPMPPHDDGVWRTYTNVVYANGVLLMPIFPDQDAEGRRRALLILSGLLPGWQVVGVDASQIANLGGALHCVTMNLGVIRKLPSLPSPRFSNPLAPLDLPRRTVSRRF